MVQCEANMKALEKRYRIVQTHEVWHFQQKTDTLFEEYKIKLEDSGYPKKSVTDKQKQWYVNDILKNQGIQWAIIPHLENF